MNPYNNLDKRIRKIRKIRPKLPLNNTSMQFYAVHELLKKTDNDIISIIESNLTNYRLYVMEKRRNKLENGML